VQKNIAKLWRQFSVILRFPRTAKMLYLEDYLESKSDRMREKNWAAQEKAELLAFSEVDGFDT
jgi:hypothetical protein